MKAGVTKDVCRHTEMGQLSLLVSDLGRDRDKVAR